MAKDPAFLFYSSDFLVGTMTMSFEEKGKYIYLLALMHQKGRLSHEIIKNLVGEISEQLHEKFLIDENGKWYNEKLEDVITLRKKHSNHQKENAKKRWNKQDDDTKPMPNEYQNDTKTNTKKIPLENEIEDENENKTEEETALQKTVKNLKNVSSLKNQLTIEQSEKLEKKYSKEEIWNTLLAMENKADLKKKYVSVYLTLTNWIKLSHERQSKQTTTTHRPANASEQNKSNAKLMGDFYTERLRQFADSQPG